MTGESKLPVYLRLKPKKVKADGSDQFISIVPGNTQVVVEPPKGGRAASKETFSFSGVYDPTTTQLKLYQATVFPLVENVLRGNDSLFFTMGASGSGKTHTILGHKRTPGMVHLAVDTIFKSIVKHMADFEIVETLCDAKNPSRTSSAQEAGLILDWAKAKSPGFLKASMCQDRIEVNDKYQYAVYLSMVEIYNDRIFDLFDDDESPRDKQKQPTRRKALITKTDPDTGRTFLANVKKIFVSDTNEAYKIIDKGLSVRSAHSTESNSTSSRSHAFTIVEVKRIPPLSKKDKNGNDLPVKSSTFTVVDLAGSERVKVSKTNGSRLVESCAINKSLMLLGQCLQKQRDRELAISSSNTSISNSDGIDHNDDVSVKTAASSNKHFAKSDFSIFRNSKLTYLLMANAFNKDLNQKSALLVTIDPFGDCNSAAQILRYSALARDVSVPKTRITSVSSLYSNSSDGNSIKTSSLSQQSSRSVSSTSNNSSMSGASTLFDEPPCTVTESQHVSTKMLMARIQQLEAELESTHEQYLLQEQQLREELTTDMDTRMQQLQDRFMDSLQQDSIREQALTDRKLEILSDTIKETSYQELQSEIQRLNVENFQLNQEISEYKKRKIV